ncbi:protein CHLOROPLAST IMPORT APPARATUS 2-like [Cornus florida]|uniref:protein CHLOROPLAST IMPORT APPARATUS 2-like n=1 Tax=Cornus florida TaxID=4283 RepID=UPI00289B8853|nr:protein CHLOROPLAST IMPORT APPARATUS 2-like [Cornus florida]XP_059637514.1 protein CHLOROPLAST IMPORT APPARATUS 2-like [Cornus florida]XP_059637515.1 protein CHLOROPLAST IMPORT APPARATUS 2-like [Cornus florida]XP_059637516.1 protein CHLOROPLAST IMPORT APPARATUS 2-like [Cornus florida]
MSSCLSGGGRAYGFELEIMKSPSTSSITSHSSSPSSTLSESSNSPLAISTRKPRTPRKRPNQTYNEAATLLSTAYPKIFSTKHLTKPCKFTKPLDSFLNESPEVLLPFRVIDNSCFLLHQPIQEKRTFQIEPKAVNSCEKRCHSPVENDFHSNSLDLCSGYEDDFDAESILDEEIEEGIDSIMGNLCVTNGESNANCYGGHTNTCHGLPLGLGFGRKFDLGFGMRRGVRALRNVDEGDWWKFPTVDVLDISPKFTKVSVEKKKKKIEKPTDSKSSEFLKGNSTPKSPMDNSSASAKSNPGLLLKLNYDDVLNAWSDRESPFSDEVPGSGLPGNDVNARLAQIDLFSESGGLREASVLRYKEKRRTRLFSRKIRYQVRKVNADRRPRMKGRFVRRENSPVSEQ